MNTQPEVIRIAYELDDLSHAKKRYYSGAQGQTLGCESYILKGSGFSFSCIDEAAQELIALHKKNEELTETLKGYEEQIALHKSHQEYMDRRMSDLVQYNNELLLKIKELEQG